MASFFKNLFRKENDSQPVPAASLTNDPPQHSRVAGMAAIEQPVAVPARSGLPQSSGGPFSAVSGRHMTARELAAFLPPALLRFDGVSPDQPVPLPVDSLRQSMLAGRPTLRLSQIQAACPLLFQRAPQPDEDVEVTLPLARVKGILESSGPVPAPATPFEALPGSTDRPAPEASNPFAAFPAQGPPPLPPAGQAAPAVSPAAVSHNPFAVPLAMESASPFSPAFQPPAAPVAASPFVNLPPAAVSPFAAEFAAVVAAPPAASPFAPAAAIPTPGPPVTPQPPAVASPFLAMASPAGPATRLGLPASSLPFTPSVPVFPDLAGASSRAPGVEASPVKAPSPFQVVHPGSFPATAAPLGGESAAPSVPISPMQPQPFGLPAATASSRPPAAIVPSAARDSLPTTPAAPQGFPSVATQRSASVPWTPPVSAAPSANGAALPVLPRSAPAPASSSFGTGSPPVLPSGPPPVIGAAFPSPFQAVNPSPALPIPLSAPVPVAAPVPGASLGPLTGSPSASAPVTTASAPSPAAADAMLELSLRVVLRDADPAHLGFAPENVPESVRVALPLDLVTRQLASGRVEVRVDDIRAGITEKFRPAFARAVADLKIVVPMSEVFHNLPESAKPALGPSTPVDGHLSITTSPFQTPFAIKAEEDRKQLLDLSATGFDPAQMAQRPATQPIPATELPPAPLPPVLPALSGAPTVQVELPPLRPAASAAPHSGADSAPLPRPGLLSRPPGSGTSPIPPRTAPRLKPMPISPTALRPFPKPPAPPEAAPSTFPPASPPPLLVPRTVDPGLPPAAAAEMSSLAPLNPPVAPMVPPSLRPAEPELLDDLGESFSAARLGAEPPPRAGSAPVSLPTRSSDAGLPTPGLETSQPLSLTSLVPTPALPVPPAPERSVPEWESKWATPALPPAVPSVLPEPRQEAETPRFSPVFEAVAHEPTPPADPAPVMDFAPAVETTVPESVLLPFPPVCAPVPASVTGPVEDLSFGCVSEIRQLTLRAVLGTDQVLAPQDIVDRCASLAGLKACALFRQDSALVSQGMDATTAAAFRSSAGQTRDSLMALADSLGLGSGGNFTLRTDHGVRSFFLEPGLCLAVWHEQPAFTPGTREKLILVTQELARD